MKRVQKKPPPTNTPEEWFSLVLEILNSDRRKSLRRQSNPVDPRAIALIIWRLQQLENVAESFAEPHKAKRMDRHYALLNRRLAKYLALPYASPHGPRNTPEIHWRCVYPDHPGELEIAIVSALMDIAQAGQIRAFKRCEQCNKWICAAKGTQRFCPGGICRDAFHRTNEADRIRRREWAKKNYQARIALERGKR